MAVIELRGLSRQFKGRVILDNLSLQFAAGEKVAIRGANGSGKTTLLRVLATLLAPSSGSISWFGGQSRTHIRQRMGWCPAADGGFIGQLGGRENLHYWAAQRGLTRAQAERTLASWPLGTTLRAALETPFSLQSAGMQQALRLVAATLGEPQILLLDEPTRGLDESTSEELLSALRARGGTIVFSSHSQPLCQSLASRMLELRDGRCYE